MTKDEDFKLLKIQTIILKVNIHCDGCKQKVKKLLQRIEGVYTVSIDAEHQKVTVSGNVDPATLIRKLARAGKYAELWSQKANNTANHKPNQQHQQKQQSTSNSGKDGNKSHNNNHNHQSKEGLMQGLKALKNQHNKKLPSFSSDEEDGEDDDEDDDDDYELGFLEEKMKQMNLLKPPNNMMANVQKNGNGHGHGHGGNNNNGGKKSGGSLNQNQGMKPPNGADPRGMHAVPNTKMGNPAAHLGLHPNGGGEGKVNFNDMNGMMGLGLQGLGANAVGIHQAQQQLGSNLPGSTGFPSNGVSGFGGQYHQQQLHQAPMMMNMQGYQNHPSSVMMNMRGYNNNMMPQPQPQPQVVYNRAPQIPPYTGYYSYYPSPSPYYLTNQSEASDYGAHMFSDENTHGCVVM